MHGKQDRTLPAFATIRAQQTELDGGR